MSGETNFDKLIKEMKPELNVGEYIFSSVSSIDAIKKEHILCEFKEKEGITVVLERQYADLHQLSYDYRLMDYIECTLFFGCSRRINSIVFNRTGQTSN